MAQLASIVSQLDALKAAGAARVLVTAVNDPFVLAAFAKPYAAHAPFLQFLADPDAEFALAIDAAVDLSAAGLGLRSTRYALVVNQGRIEHQLVEDKPSQLVHTDAARVVPLLSQSLQQTLEAKVAAGFAARKPVEVIRSANFLATHGLPVSAAVYAALVQTAAECGMPHSAQHLVKHWQADAAAGFSAADAAQCAKWIAAAPKQPRFPVDEQFQREIEEFPAWRDGINID